MKTSVLKGALAGLACLGMALPTQSFAETARTSQVAKKVRIADVALTQGTLNGKVVDSQGQILDAAEVRVSKANKLVATAMTNSSGEFAVHNLDSGLYQVSTTDTQSVVRLWEGSVAPPAAKNQVLLVKGATTRGQDNPFDYVVLGTAVVGVALGGAALADDGETIIVSP